MSDRLHPGTRPRLRDHIRRYGQIVIALPLLAVLAIGAVGAPVLVGHDPNRLNPRAKVEPPSLVHLLGTDEFGRDILSRLAHGARITILVAAASVLLAAGGGTLLGSVAAYAGRRIESRLISSAVLGPSIGNSSIRSPQNSQFVILNS